MPGDNGVEPAPAVEIHLRTQPVDALGQQAGQAPVDGNVGLPGDHRQFRRVHEGHPADVVQQLLVGDAHVSSVTDEWPGGQQAPVSAGV